MSESKPAILQVPSRFFFRHPFFISGPVIIPVAFSIEGRASLVSVLSNHAGFIVLIGLLQTFILYGAFYTGVGMIPASVAAIIIGAQPLLSGTAANIRISRTPRDIKPMALSSGQFIVVCA